jgi:uncharacterized protein YndB with AHSA1/START domain
MDLHIIPAPVKKSILVNASPARAFDVFTSCMIRWWRPDHHIGAAPLKDVVLEPRVGGRWYEIDEDGSVCEWGKVLAYDPPNRILLAWQLNAEWKYDANFVTELDVRFIAVGTVTRVELEHRNIERFGGKAEAVRASLDSPGGWTGGLSALAAYIEQTEARSQ